MLQSVNNLAYRMHDLGAGIDRKGLADCLAAYGKARSQCGHAQGYDLRPGKIKLPWDC